MNDKKGKMPVKAYRNLDFMNSPDARPVRVLSEFLEPAARFRKHRIHDTIVFFGSSRIEEPAVAEKELKEVEKALGRKKQSQKDKQKLKAARIAVEMSQYYEDARRLAQLLTEWSISLGRGKRRFIVCSGGGPGIMEAANRGATEHKKGYSVGLNISLPFEQYPNPYITDELNFEFHYFFIRKYWFLYLAKALVVFPGGYGTLDELFEVLTMVQTDKVRKKIPVLIYGKSFWDKIINFDMLVEYGTISKKDLELFHFSDDPQEAFEYLKGKLTGLYLRGR
jgi:uncharacterized protein (TIGR00730 family)